MDAEVVDQNVHKNSQNSSLDSSSKQVVKFTISDIGNDEMINEDLNVIENSSRQCVEI